jgi:chaperonin GroES
MATATMTATKKKVKFRPIEDRVLIEPIEAEDRTTGGIILPDTAKEKPVRGTVIARGPGKLLDNGKRGEMSVSVGDEVFYGKYSGTEIEIGSDKYIVLRETDILAIVEN